MVANSPRDAAIPLRTLNPADPDVSDLGVLRDVVGNTRLVAIGESAHGVREFYQLKDRIFRYLVSELGFTAFVMESGFPEAMAVNDWVLGGEGDLDHLSRVGITYTFGDCEEMRAQLRWMRDWNASHDRKVRFYGMDVPGSCANPGPAIATCLSRLPPDPEDDFLLVLSDLGERYEARIRYSNMASADRKRLSKGVAKLVQRARSSGNEAADRCAQGVKTLDDLLTNGLAPPAGRNPRDELMADNIRSILEREARVVVSAHNGHIQKTRFHGLPMLGQILALALGEDMISVGTTFASGALLDFRVLDQSQTRFAVSMKALQPPPPHTIDALMDGVGLPLHLVDLRGAFGDNIAAATAMVFNHDPIDLSPKDAFDALIHVSRVTTVAGAFAAARDAIARADASA